MIMIPKHRTCTILLYTAKLDTVSGDDMGPGLLQTTFKHVVGFYAQHMSETTNTIDVLFINFVTYNKYITNIYVLFENSVTYIKCEQTCTCCLKIKPHITKIHSREYVVEEYIV